MAAKEIPSSGDYIEKWSDEGIDQLHDYLTAFRPTLQTVETEDIFALAQRYQHDMDREESKAIRLEMGLYGAKELNDHIPDEMADRRLAIIARRLFALTGSDDDTERYMTALSQPVFVSGIFDSFVVGSSDNKDRISVELVYPKFLKPRLDRQTKRFATVDRFAIPVEALSARIYEPTELL